MTQGRWIRCACVALVGALVLGGMPVAVGASSVEELTRRLPEGVVGFVATSGGDALKGDFGKTALGKIWNDPGVRSFCQSLKTELLAKAKQQAKDADVSQKVDLATQYAQLLLGRPLIVGAVQTQVKEGPPVCAFAIVDAGDRKAELVAAISKLETMAGEGEVIDAEVGSLKMRGLKDKDLPLYWGWVENHLVIGVNDTQAVVTKYVASPRAAAPPYLKKVPAHGDALVVSMSNLKQIGLGLIMYANDHQGEWPADLEQAKSYWGNSRILESPRKPKDFAGPSYVYVSGQPKTIDPHNIVVYENPAFSEDKINVLFADGHVESMKPEAFRRELKATCERLGQEMPAIQFKGESEVKPRPPRPAGPGKSSQT